MISPRCLLKKRDWVKILTLKSRPWFKYGVKKDYLHLATMSSLILQDKLRGEMGYNNIIITDAMEMGAITQQYTSAEAAVGCILAGADIVLGPHNFIEAFDAVVKAVEDGVITEDRIDQSVRRILRLKKEKR